MLIESVVRVKEHGRDVPPQSTMALRGSITEKFLLFVLCQVIENLPSLLRCSMMICMYHYEGGLKDNGLNKSRCTS